MKNRKSSMKRRALCFAAAMALVLGGGMQLYATSKKADTVYYNGTIYTVTESLNEAKDVGNAKKAEVVATQNGKIVFVGSKAEAIRDGYLDEANVGKLVDLKGKVMLPGFVDGHGHFPGGSQIDLFNVNLNCPPLGPVTNMADLIRLLKEKAQNTPSGGWVRGSNYDDSMIAEMRHPNRDDLDQASRDHYVWAEHSSGHMCAVNSKIIDEIILPKGRVQGNEFISNETGQIVDGVEIKNGRLTGMLFEMNAMGLFAAPSMSAEQSRQIFARGAQAYSAAGVTTADQGWSYMVDLPGLQQSVERAELNVRVILHPTTYLHGGVPNHSALKWEINDPGTPLDDAPTAASPKVGDDLTRYAVDDTFNPASLPENYLLFGSWKQVYDGSNQGYTGWFKRPGYWDKGKNGPNDPRTGAPDPNAPNALLGLTGTFNFSKEKLIESMDFYTKNEQPVETHTNGSAAAEDYMTAIELAIANNRSADDLRHTFIHGQMQERQIVERAVGKYDELDATAPMYEDLSGTARQSGTDTDAHGKAWTATDLRDALKNGELIKKQNLVTSYFVNHTYFWGDRHMEIYMGPGRAKQQNPQGWAAYYGHPYTSHNDTPITPISPLRSLQSSVTRTSTGGQVLSGSSTDINAKASYPETKGGSEREFWDFDQRLNALQALHAVTILPAYQNHLDPLIGSIQAGKLADFVILDKDPIRVAVDTPLKLSEMRVATTIVGDKVVHGILPDSEVLLGNISAGYGQLEGVDVTGIEASALTKEDEKHYASIGKDEKRLGTLEFTAAISGNKSGVFQFTFLGNGGTPADYRLYQLQENKSFLYTYGKPAPEDMGTASGSWWIADMDNPTIPLEESHTLDMNKTYIAFFTMGDNDETDLDAAEGMLKNRIALATTGPLPDNGAADTNASSDDDDSSSGCTVGSTPAYDLLVLLLGFSAIALIRVARRRNA